MNCTTDNTAAIAAFWEKFPSHIEFLEQCIRLGHNHEFQGRYDAVNDGIAKLHSALRVEFSFNMLEANIEAIVITSKEKGEPRKLAHQIAGDCPEQLKPLVTPYRLPALPWESKVTLNWLYDMCSQYGMKSVAKEVGESLEAATYAVKMNPNTGKLMIQVAFKNNREIKAVGKEIVMLMFDLLLGEQIIAEAVEVLTIKTQRELHGRKGEWEFTNGLGMRDAILRALM